MGKNPQELHQASQLNFQCQCGKRIVTSIPPKNRAIHCPICHRKIAVPDTKIQTESSEAASEADHDGFRPKTMLAMWGLVGIAALAGSVFLAWHFYASGQAEVAQANARLSQAMSSATLWLDEGETNSGDGIEQQLANALRDESIADSRGGEALLQRVRGRLQANTLLAQAQQELSRGRVTESIVFLQKYLANPDAATTTDAEELLDECEAAVSEERVLAALVSLDDAAFDRARSSGRLDEPRIKHPILIEVHSKTVERVLERAREQRQAEKLAEQQAKLDRQKNAERKQELFKRHEPLFDKMSLDEFVRQYPEATQIYEDIDARYEQWQHRSMFLDVTGSFIKGKMVGLAIDDKYYPGEDEQIDVRFEELQSVLGEPDSTAKVGIHRNKDIVWRWFDVPQNGYLVIAAYARSPFPGSRTGGEIHYLRVEILDQKAFAAAAK